MTIRLCGSSKRAEGYIQLFLFFLGLSDSFVEFFYLRVVLVLLLFFSLRGCFYDFSFFLRRVFEDGYAPLSQSSALFFEFVLVLLAKIGKVFLVFIEKFVWPVVNTTAGLITSWMVSLSSYL